jgi:SAM-dependent methyltransferase
MWEERYSAEGDYLFGRAPAAILAENPWLWQGMGSALCVADGEGRNAVFLAGQGLEVAAFDLSPTAVARAEALAAQAGVRVDTRVSDWSGYDWDRQVDMVVAIFVQFVGPDDRPAQFADMARALRPGGRLVLHGYRPEQVEHGTGGPPSRENMYTEGLLRDAFPGWQVERLAGYDRDVDEGRGHSGRSALIDFVARKPG